MIKTYVIDTNVLIQAPYAIECFEENNLVLPLVVLEELDGLKKAEGEKGANARAAVRKLESYRQKGDLLQGVKLPGGGILRIEKNFVQVELPLSTRAEFTIFAAVSWENPDSINCSRSSTTVSLSLHASIPEPMPSERHITNLPPSSCLHI